MQKYFLLTTDYKVIYLGEFQGEDKALEEAVAVELHAHSVEALSIIDRDQFQKLYGEVTEIVETVLY